MFCSKMGIGRFLLSLMMLLSVQTLFGKAILQGAFYKEESKGPKSGPVFTLEKVELLKNGAKVWESRFYNSKKELVALEKLMLVKGRPTEYAINQIQVKEEGRFYLKDNILKMYYSKNKRDSSATLIWDDATILPPMIPSYLKENQKDLKNKGLLSVKLVVPHLLTSVSYDFRLIDKKEAPCLKSASYCVSFSPGYFFIRWMVDPLILSLGKDFRIMKASGPSLLYIKENLEDDWSPFKGDATFTYNAD